MSPKTLWIFNHYAITPDLPGGTRHFDLGRRLVQRGWRVVIFASAFSHSLHEYVKLSKGEQWKVEETNGVTFVWLRPRPSYRGNGWRRALNMLDFALRGWWLGRKLPKRESNIPQPDIVIGSSPHLLTPLAALGISHRFGAKFVMEVRDLWPQTIIAMGVLNSRHPIVRALRWLERFLYQRAIRIIVLMPRADSYICKLGIPRKKILWIPNGVDVRAFPTECRKPTREDSTFTLMYVGAHGPANGLSTVLAAAACLLRKEPAIRFLLYGDGAEKPRLMQKADQESLTNIEFHPAVPKREIPRLLAGADVLLLNYARIGITQYGISPNKLWDYMAAGKPVIFAHIAPNNPVDEVQCGATIPPEDPGALAESAIRLFQMPKEGREAMGIRGRKYVEQHHAIPMLAEKLIQCIEEVL